MAGIRRTSSLHCTPQISSAIKGCVDAIPLCVLEPPPRYYRFPINHSLTGMPSPHRPFGQVRHLWYRWEPLKQWCHSQNRNWKCQISLDRSASLPHPPTPPATNHAWMGRRAEKGRGHAQAHPWALIRAILAQMGLVQGTAAARLSHQREQRIIAEFEQTVPE